MTEINPEDHVIDGQSFYSSALTGAGTITSDGVVGPPTPDPSVLRGTVEPPRNRVSPVIEEPKQKRRRTKAEIEAAVQPEQPPAE